MSSDDFFAEFAEALTGMEPDMKKWIMSHIGNDIIEMTSGKRIGGAPFLGLPTAVICYFEFSHKRIYKIEFSRSLSEGIDSYAKIYERHSPRETVEYTLVCTYDEALRIEKSFLWANEIKI